VIDEKLVFFMNCCCYCCVLGNIYSLLHCWHILVWSCRIVLCLF